MFKWWYFDEWTGEAVIVLAEDGGKKPGDWSVIRVGSNVASQLLKRGHRSFILQQNPDE